MHTGISIEDCELAVDRATGKKPIFTTVPLVPVGFGVAPELHDRMVDTAVECGTSLSELCRVAIAFYLDRLEGESRG